MEEFKLGLIGYPLGHSLSPILYETAFKEFNMKGSYEILPTQSEDLINRLKFLRTHKYYGFNVTIPHKVPVSLFLSKYDEFVNMTGSVNTIKIEQDLSLSGYNTDVYGFCEAIPKDFVLEGKKAAVLGTGGASRAVCAGLYSLGIAKIDLYTRNILDSSETIQTFRNKFDKVEINAIQLSEMKTLEDVDILINTTPVGMKNFDEDNAIVNDDNIKSLSDEAIVYDIVYNPLKTSLIAKAIKYDKKYICGLDMLVHQACRAFEIWFDKKPNFETLKNRALEQEILRR